MVGARLMKWINVARRRIAPQQSCGARTFDRLIRLQILNASSLARDFTLRRRVEAKVWRRYGEFSRRSLSAKSPVMVASRFGNVLQTRCAIRPDTRFQASGRTGALPVRLQRFPASLQCHDPAYECETPYPVPDASSMGHCRSNPE